MQVLLLTAEYLHSSLLDVTVLGDTSHLLGVYLITRFGYNFLKRGFIMRRSRMSRRRSRRSFTRGAVRVQSRNLMAAPMRGGIRL